MATCLTFVVIGLLEFAVVNVLTRVDSRKIPNAKSDKPSGDKERDILVAIDKENSAVQYDSGHARDVRICLYIIPIYLRMYFNDVDAILGLVNLTNDNETNINQLLNS